ncbi:hypothetical protein GCM10010232_40520 [Streptomyces amakusaensis]
MDLSPLIPEEIRVRAYALESLGTWIARVMTASTADEVTQNPLHPGQSHMTG